MQYLTYQEESIDLTKFSVDELNYLNFKEENHFALEIKKLEPFSKKRFHYMKEAYKKIFIISNEKKSRLNQKTYGATNASINLLKILVKQQNINVFYEAGVANLFAIKQLDFLDKNKIYGCDIFLENNLKKGYKNIHENDLYHDLLNLPDNFIDFFYADNVMEHIVEDEYQETLKLIVKKMKKGGLLYFIIPNLYNGPDDASKYALKRGEKACCFHFMQRSYKDNINDFYSYGLRVKYDAIYIKSNEIKVFKSNKLTEQIKIFFEKMIAKETKYHLLKRLGYDLYILEKK